MKSGLYLIAGCVALLATGTTLAATPAASARIRARVFTGQPASLERVQAVLRKALPGVPPPSPPPAPKFNVTALEPRNDNAFLEFFNVEWADYHPVYGGIVSFGSPLILDEGYVGVYWKGTQGANYLIDCEVNTTNPTLKIAGLPVAVDAQHALFVAKANAGVGTGGFSNFEIHAATKKSGFVFKGCTFAPV